MIHAMHRTAAFALYQLTLALGILLMPVAICARRLGVRFPFQRAIDAANAAYERADGAGQNE